MSFARKGRKREKNGKHTIKSFQLAGQVVKIVASGKTALEWSLEVGHQTANTIKANKTNRLLDRVDIFGELY